MAGKKSGLGRGLDALFPEKTVQSKPKTVKTVKEEKNTSFIAINDLLYKGIGGEKGISESQSQANDLLYTADSFHPNNIGYQIMADAVFKEYQVINEK